MTPSSPSRRPLWLWVLAFLIMAGTVVFQRRTGPTYPARLTLQWQGVGHAIKLPRSQTNTEPAPVVLPSLGPGTDVALVYRRYPTQDPWNRQPLVPNAEGRLVGALPIQPPAGKVAYRFELSQGDRVQAWPESPVVLRYKGPVPSLLLASHVVLMFLGVLWGIRTGLGSLWNSEQVATQARITFGMLTLGGMLLGPMVQKHAFGAYWTGWPYGYDLTDNKTLLMWGVWLLAILVGWGLPRAGRLLAGAAAVVMLGVYLVPHSLRGSQLDYQQQRVTTGRP